MPSTHARASPMMRCLRVAFMLDSSALDGHQGNTGTYVPRPCPEGLLSKDDCNHDTSSNHSYTNESVCDDSARQRLFRHVLCCIWRAMVGALGHVAGAVANPCGMC